MAHGAAVPVEASLSRSAENTSGDTPPISGALRSRKDDAHHTSPLWSIPDIPDVGTVLAACTAWAITSTESWQKEKPRPTTQRFRVCHRPWLLKHAPFSTSITISFLQVRQYATRRLASVSGRIRISRWFFRQSGQVSHPELSTCIISHFPMELKSFAIS